MLQKVVNTWSYILQCDYTVGSLYILSLQMDSLKRLKLCPYNQDWAIMDTTTVSSFAISEHTSRVVQSWVKIIQS